MIIFSKASGQVSSFIDPTLPARTTFNIEGFGGFAGFKSIVTRVTVAARGNFQFLHSLGGQVFVYVFGDRIGQLNISGLSFDATCDDPDGSLGIEYVLDYYSDFRIANRATPIKVTLGVSTTLSAYLLGVNGDVVDPKSRIWQYSLELGLIPDEDVEDDVASGAELSAGVLSEDIAAGDIAVSPELGATDGLDTGGATLRPGIVRPVTSTGFAPVGSGPNLQLVKAVAI